MFLSWFSCRFVLYLGSIGIWSVGFYGARNTEEPKKKLSEQGENQQLTQPTNDSWLEYIWATLVGGERPRHW